MGVNGILGSYPILALVVLVLISLKVFAVNSTEQLQNQGVSNMNSQKFKKFLVASAEVFLAIGASIVSGALT